MYKKNRIIPLCTAIIVALSGCGFDEAFNDTVPNFENDSACHAESPIFPPVQPQPQSSCMSPPPPVDTPPEIYPETPRCVTQNIEPTYSAPITKPTPLVPIHYTPIKKKIIQKTPPQYRAKSLVPVKKVTTWHRCEPNLFLLQPNISKLYKIYFIHNKSCRDILDKKVSNHFVTLLSQYYTSQEIRILNADTGFLNLYATAIQNADIAEKNALNEKVLEYGCHLLKPYACKMLKGSMILDK
jgi:hypothetical protein